MLEGFFWIFGYVIIWILWEHWKEAREDAEVEEEYNRRRFSNDG